MEITVLCNYVSEALLTYLLKATSWSRFGQFADLNRRFSVCVVSVVRATEFEPSFLVVVGKLVRGRKHEI